MGVPVIGCRCRVCTSEDPRNNRTRSSVVVRAGGVTLLVDSGSDLRQQALREGLSEIDAVLYTHAHLDHVAGFDELRAFCWRRDEPLPLHATAGCLESLRTMFGWAFSEDNTHKGYVKPDPRRIDGPFRYGPLRIEPLPVEHASVETIGYLFEYADVVRLAYLPDVKRIPEGTMERMRGVDVMIIDALRPAPHPTHFSLSDALAAVRESAAREAWLTHLGHENDHAELQAVLPENVRVAWDGLRLEAPVLA